MSLVLGASDLGSQDLIIVKSNSADDLVGDRRSALVRRQRRPRPSHGFNTWRIAGAHKEPQVKRPTARLLPEV